MAAPRQGQRIYIHSLEFAKEMYLFSSLPFIYLFSILISVWAHRYLFYKPILPYLFLLLRLFKLWVSEILSVGTACDKVPSVCVCVCARALGTPSLGGTVSCSSLTVYNSCSALASAIYLRRLCSSYWRRRLEARVWVLDVLFAPKCLCF